VSEAAHKKFKGKKVAVLCSGLSNGEQGGAERFYSGLVSGFQSIGCNAELVSVPADEPNFEQILDNYESCRQLELQDYDIVISTKSPTYAVKHPNHVVYLIHTVRVFDDMFEDNFPKATKEHYRQRSILHKLDFCSLSGAKARFAIGHEVAERLYKWRGLDCSIIHPPLEFDKFYSLDAEDFFFMPGRLHKWKRVQLVIEAVKLSSKPIRLVIAGDGDYLEELRALAGSDKRIKFLGRVSDVQLADYYARSLAVPFVPIREDYGYVTLEAFASCKPVITCTDSGEPASLVEHSISGLVVTPEATHIKEAMEWMWAHRDQSAAMGKSARTFINNMSWTRVAAQLAESALEPKPNLIKCPPISVSVLDMQPIDPPVGGGRLRLLGLYHGLGANFETRYTGSYDWLGESHRTLQLSDTLTETTIPLSDEHHRAASVLSKKANGKIVIDLAFSRLADLSPEYIDTAAKEIRDAQVVIFSHPWVYPLVKDSLRPSHLVIYDSHNVESYLRAQLLDRGNPVEEELLRQVAQDEYDVGTRADWILACSHEDLLRFNRVYGFPLDKIRVVPNGVMAFESDDPKTPKKELHESLEISGSNLVAIFIGSPYGPNIDAARFIESELAPRMRDVDFVIAGGVGEGRKSSQSNVLYTGQLDDSDRARWLNASDIAVNPMMSGSGTNIKMFDFMAASLPVVSTAIGARGIDTGGRGGIFIAEPNPDSFCSAIDKLRDEAIRSEAGKNGRLCVEEGYSWERISSQLGTFIASRVHTASQSRPLFSVVIPTYERHEHLSKLFGYLSAQVDRDFEVIVVDQSESRWSDSAKNFGFMMTYYHSPVKGAVRARNTGAMLAQGEIIAFIDDDCFPDPRWLLNARPYFKDNSALGLEGIIESDHLKDPAWRPVSNVGFEGLGFMTANLFVRSEVFQLLGGFDLQFDHPHFREDTDLGWRIQELGEIPYAKDVSVFHPALPTHIERESAQERAKFFQKDAILYQKHKEKYKQLFFAEGNYKNTPEFSRHFRIGFDMAGETVPDWAQEYLQSPHTK